MARWWLISRVWTHATEYLRYICGNKIKKWRFFRDFVRLKNTTYRSRLYFIRFYSFLFRKSGAVWRWSWFVRLQRGSDRRRWWAKPSMEINSALTASGRTYSRDFLLSLRHDTYAVDMEISSSIYVCAKGGYQGLSSERSQQIAEAWKSSSTPDLSLSEPTETRSNHGNLLAGDSVCMLRRTGR